MDCDQDGNRAHEALFTGIASTPGSEHTGAIENIHITAYSPLKAAEDIKLQLGWYAPSGANGAKVIQKLLQNQPAPVVIDGDGELLADTIVAEQNDNCATMVDEILEAMNWKMQITGDGTIRLSEKLEIPDPVLIMGTNDNDILETSYSKGRDWFSCPNVLLASTGTETATARDDDPNSELSTVTRGREIQSVEENVQLSENENIRQYAARRLKELQVRTETVSYTRRYMPEINVGDAIRLNYNGLNGVYEVMSQSITLGTSARTQEEVKRTITVTPNSEGIGEK